jgi:maltose/maltodextrin transport system substrate-binding protein
MARLRFEEYGNWKSRSGEGLSKTIALIQAGVLPKSVSYSAVEDLMGQGKVAMIVSGPWAWSNLIKNGIDFAVAPLGWLRAG